MTEPVMRQGHWWLILMGIGLGLDLIAVASGFSERSLMARKRRTA